MTNSNDDPRARAIQHWLGHDLQLQIKQFETASSDASFRRYFRVFHNQGKHIVMDAPPELENIGQFIKVAGIFAKSEINVPDIFQKNLQQGFLLLEDFGSRCLLDELDAENAGSFYLIAMDSLFKLQTGTDITINDLPKYNQELLNRELTIFTEWFLQKMLNLSIPENEQTIISDAFTILTQSALEQPRVCVHRDFHSRNLMYTETDTLGIIDFQDAVIGPVTYDLVSLLRDCYIAWPENKVYQWMTEYYNRLCGSGIITCDLNSFKRWFDLMGLQRHLKAIGIFSRLRIRDGKTAYLRDIPRTMNYVTQVCRQYPELSGFHDFLQNRILPVDHLAS